MVLWGMLIINKKNWLIAGQEEIRQDSLMQRKWWEEEGWSEESYKRCQPATEQAVCEKAEGQAMSHMA